MAVADVQYLHSDAEPIVAPALLAQATEVGDLVAIDSSGDLYRAEDETWDTDEATTRQNFVANFLGVCAQRKVANESLPYGNSEAKVRVNTAGVFRFKATSATYQVGELVGPEKDTGNNLLSTTVQKVTADNEAIAQVVERAVTSTTVVARLLSRKSQQAV